MTDTVRCFPLSSHSYCLLSAILEQSKKCPNGVLCLFFNSTLLAALRHGTESFLSHTVTILITRLVTFIMLFHCSPKAVSGSHCPGKMYTVSSSTTCTFKLNYFKYAAKSF